MLDQKTAAMKKISASTFASALWNTVAVFGVIVVAGVLGVAIAGAFAYHQLGRDAYLAKTHPVRSHAEPPVVQEPSPALLPPVQPIQDAVVDRAGEAGTGNRPVAADPLDQAHFTYADYHIDVSRIPMATFVRGRVSDILPPPLAPAAESPGNAFADERHMPSLSDPGSHYIIDSRTGRVIGIDGTAGAADEARRQPPAPTQLTVSARPKPVLAALPVDEPAYGNLPPPKPDLYTPARRAMPLIEISHGQPFDAAAEVADDSRPVMRAEPVIVAPVARPTRHPIPFP